MPFLATEPQTTAFFPTADSAYVRRVSQITEALSRADLIRDNFKEPSIRVELTVGGRPLVYRMNAADWARAVFESLAQRWAAEPGWDGHQARPTDPDLVADLLNWLGQAMPKGAKPPVITPLHDGGVQAEWHKGGSSLEIAVSADEPARFDYFSDEGDLDGVVADCLPDLRRLIATF